MLFIVVVECYLMVNKVEYKTSLHTHTAVVRLPGVS